MNEILKYLNNNPCVTLPRRKTEYSSAVQYDTEYEKLELLDSLGITGLIDEQNKSFENKLSGYVTLLFLLDNFVKKADIYDDDDEDSYFGDEDEDWSSKITESSSIIQNVSIDDELSLASRNPVQNRVITKALSEKLGLDDLTTYLREYSTLTKLLAGYGINIEGSVISVNLDINPFVVVNSLPTTNININKIYLVRSEGNNYIQYKYIVDIPTDICVTSLSGRWSRVGELYLGFDLSNYLSSKASDERYQLKGDYVTTYELNNLLKIYVKKSEVYTPDLWGNTEEQEDIPSEIPVPSELTNPVTITIDSLLDKTSENPLLNKVIARALELKQDLLIPGEGITIENGIISSTIDPFLYEITTKLPLTGKANKIYILETEDGNYSEYLYLDNSWIYKGQRNLNVDLSKYLVTEDLLPYATKEDLLSYATTEDLLEYVSKEEFSELGDTFYQSSIADGVKSNITVGNIDAGTDIAFLKGKTFSELFDMLLFKEIWPTTVAHHTISLAVQSEIVKVGSPMLEPIINVQWNEDITPINTINYTLSRTMDSYNTHGTLIFTLDYSYPEGELIIISNYGNSKGVTIPEGSGLLTKTVKVTYPWYINDIELNSLIPVGTLNTTTVTLTGTPNIAIPGDLSICNIKANLGLGFMDVNWNKTIILKNGVPYSVWTKPDSYSQDVEHELTFTYIFA